MRGEKFQNVQYDPPTIKYKRVSWGMGTVNESSRAVSGPYTWATTLRYYNTVH